MSSNENRGNHVPENNPPRPRQPRNLQELLRLAVEARSEADGSANVRENPPSGLDPENREFIANALKSLSVDVTKILMDAIELLKTTSEYEKDPVAYQNAFSSINDHVDNIDAANDFVKLGGFDIAHTCLCSEHAEVRWRMADIVAQCVQNNPFCQHEALEKGFLPVTLKMADSDIDEKCRTKAFFAASNMVRTFQPALGDFTKLNGFSIVFKAMESNIERLENKSTFFLSSILSENPQLSNEIVEKGFVVKLIAMIKKPHSAKHEHLISCLLTIAKNSQQAITECKQNKNSLLPSLALILNNYERDDTYREEISDIKELIRLIYPEDPNVERFLGETYMKIIFQEKPKN